MNATEQQRIARIEAKTIRVPSNPVTVCLKTEDVTWLISQLKAAHTDLAQWRQEALGKPASERQYELLKEELQTAQALLASHATGDAMLLEMLPGHATIAEGIQALKAAQKQPISEVSVQSRSTGDIQSASYLLFWLARIAMMQTPYKEPKVGDIVIEVTHILGTAKARVGLFDALGELKEIFKADNGVTNYVIETMEGRRRTWSNCRFVPIDNGTLPQPPKI